MIYSLQKVEPTAQRLERARGGARVGARVGTRALYSTWLRARSWPRALTALFLILCMAAAATLPEPAAAQDDDRIAQSTEELERVRSRMRALQRIVERDNRRRGDISRQLQAAETRISELLQALSKLEADIGHARNAVRSNQTERDRLEAEVAVQREQLGAQIRAAYQMGRQGRTKLLLNQQDPVAVGRILTYYDYLAQARSERIREFTALAEQLRAVSAELANNVQRLTQLQDQQRESLAAVESSRLDRQRSLSQLEAQLRDNNLKIRQLEDDEEELEELLESLQDVLADIPLNLDTGKPFGQRRGELPWPIPGDQRLFAAYGQPKAGSLRWKGVWISGNAGDPVSAVAPGRVAYVGWMHRFGLMVIVEHEGGWYSLYGHTQTAYKDIGEWVRGGETLAAAGNSGGHRRNGVYFELRRGENTVDPVVWLAPR